MTTNRDVKITVKRDGPYIVTSDVALADQHIEINTART